MKMKKETKYGGRICFSIYNSEMDWLEKQMEKSTNPVGYTCKSIIAENIRLWEKQKKDMIFTSYPQSERALLVRIALPDDLFQTVMEIKQESGAPMSSILRFFLFYNAKGLKR